MENLKPEPNETAPAEKTRETKQRAAAAAVALALALQQPAGPALPQLSGSAWQLTTRALQLHPVSPNIRKSRGNA